MSKRGWVLIGLGAATTAGVIVASRRAGPIAGTLVAFSGLGLGAMYLRSSDFRYLNEASSGVGMGALGLHAAYPDTFAWLGTLSGARRLEDPYTR